MAEKDESSVHAGYRLDRVLSITDGVFAFAVTLLVLDLVVPVLSSGASSADLWVALSNEYVSFLSYAISFLIAGAWWNAHHRIFGYIRRSDATLQWLNLLFLLWIALLPFFTKILSDYIWLQLALVLYATDQAAAGFFVALLWWYASRNHRLVDRKLKDSTIRRQLRLNAITPLWFIFSIFVSFVSLTATWIFWLAIFALHKLLP
jgi:uncharacterized membrane protein